MHKRLKIFKEEKTIELKQTLINERQRLSKMSEKVEQDLLGAPDGNLRIAHRKGDTQYYHSKTGTSKCGDYISKENIELIKKLAQKKYNENVLRYTKKVVAQMDKLLSEYDDNRLEDIYCSEHPDRQKLITPVEPIYDQLISAWMAIPYEGKGFAEDSPDIRSSQKIRVRSKSEKILADYFESIGLKYKYEAPLYLKPYGVIYPDFTFLSKKTGKEVYWEHEGMMDNPEYAKKAVSKIDLYEKNGIFPGENLILTFESSSILINSELVKELVKRYLL